MNVRFYLSHDIKISKKSDTFLNENIKIVANFTQHYNKRHLCDVAVLMLLNL